MQKWVKKTFVPIFFIFCLLFSLTTHCDYVYADFGGYYGGGHHGGGHHGGGHHGGGHHGGGDCGSVPEPSTLLLLGAGGLALYLTRQKNKK